MADGGNNGVAYYVRAHLEAFGRSRTQRRMRRFAMDFARAGAAVSSAGRSIQGSFAGTAVSAGKIAGVVAGLAGAYGLGKMVQHSIAFNEQMETAQGTLASTAQLFDFFDNAKFPEHMSQAQKDAARFRMNLKLAHGEMDRIFDIAAKSPATFEQGMKFYQNMFPGAAGITRDMDRIRELYRKGLSVGIITGGDFKVAGQQMGRILKGGAGAEFDVWKTLEKPIMNAGKNMGIFGDAVTQANVTKQFNELAAIDRLKVVEKAVESLGATTEYWAGTWVGLKSTITSIGQLFQRAFGKALFEGAKERLQRLVKLLNPEKNVFKRLEDGFAVWGKMVALPLNRLFDWVFLQVDYISRNWVSMSIKLIHGFDTFMQAAKLMLKVALMRTAVGGAVRGVGGVMEAGGAMAKAGRSIVQVMRAAGPAAPAVAALAAATAGLAVVFGGVAVHWMSNWKDILSGFREGTIVVRPLFQAVADLWAKMAALGQSFMGGSSAAGSMQTIINMATKTILGLTSALEWTVRVGAVAAVYLENIARLFGATLGVMVTATAKFVQGIMFAVKQLDRVPGVDGLSEAYEGVKAFADSSMNFTKSSLAGMGVSGTVGEKMWTAADAFAAARGQLEDSGMLGAFYKALAEREADKLNKALTQGFSGSPDPDRDLSNPPGNTTHIYKMNVIQDLRNHDPDRIIGAFKKAINSSVKRRVSANTGMAGAQ